MERDEELRANWLRKSGKWKASQLVFLDESAINRKTGERTHAWGSKGQIISYKTPEGKAETFSILPALTVRGYIVCNVYQESVNAETFRVFVTDDLLPLCSPFPGPRSVIIMDNASIHNVYSSLLKLTLFSLLKILSKLKDAKQNIYLLILPTTIQLNSHFRYLRKL